MLAQYGTPDQNPAFWNSLSPNSYLTDLSGPLQLHHGSADATVPPIYSDLLLAEVKAAGKPVDSTRILGIITTSRSSSARPSRGRWRSSIGM